MGDEVMKLSRIRQLCTEIETLEEALRRSNILTLIQEKKVATELKVENDDEKEADLYKIFVGRLDFEKPKEKEFPFRRTVFLFGIPSGNESENFLREMLAPFGTVSKIQFDQSGADGIDRKIGKRFLGKPRVYTLYHLEEDGRREPMLFKTVYS